MKIGALKLNISQERERTLQKINVSDFRIKKLNPSPSAKIQFSRKKRPGAV